MAPREASGISPVGVWTLSVANRAALSRNGAAYRIRTGKPSSFATRKVEDTPPCSAAWT